MINAPIVGTIIGSNLLFKLHPHLVCRYKEKGKKEKKVVIEGMHQFQPRGCLRHGL